MRIHVVVDISGIYYKYFFKLANSRLRHLSVLVDSEGKLVGGTDKLDKVSELYYTLKSTKSNTYQTELSTTQQLLTSSLESTCESAGIECHEKDISNIYYVLKEVEGYREELEKLGHEVSLSACFDMKSDRKEDNGEYKGNRTSSLTQVDYDNLTEIMCLLSKAGHNTYRLEGTEADDIVSKLCKEYKDSFDYTLMYTGDADLLMNIEPKVAAKRYKTTTGYSMPIDTENFEEYMSKELKCNMKYNGLMLYKCTVGDPSDNIKGISKFGKKAYDKLVDYLDTQGIDWNKQGNYIKTKEILEKLMVEGYFTEDKVKQASECLELIRPKALTNEEVPFPSKKSSKSDRVMTYGKYNMKSIMK